MDDLLLVELADHLAQPCHMAGLAARPAAARR
jgi:hypothetical protein